jgi:hypothetical protein
VNLNSDAGLPAIATVDVLTYKPVLTYTDEPLPAHQPYDYSVDVVTWKHKVQRFMKIEHARRNKILLATDAEGRRLYSLTSSGNLIRVFDVTPATRMKVLARDGHRCVQCGATKSLEIDHIVRYIDGGGNGVDNLRTLCHSCHVKRGGRA